MATRALALMIVVAAGAGISGCSLFHRHQETPQQRFMSALNRGNSAEASQIWLQMTPDDREKFRRGERVTPAVSSEQTMKILREHPVSEDQGPITIGPNTGGGLSNLPAIAAPPSAQSPPATDQR